MTPAALRLLTAILAAFLCAAHVGSPDVWFTGRAGPYVVRVLVRMPRTIPGVAELIVEIPGEVVRSVRVQTLRPGMAERVRPGPEPLRPQGGGRFTGRLWFMTEGAHGVRIEVAGARGRGEVVVPVVPIERRRPPLSAVLGAGFGALVALLVVTGVATVAAAAREGSLAERESVSASRSRAGRRAGAVTALLLVVVLAVLGVWWRDADAGFARRAYRPPPLSARLLRIEEEAGTAAVGAQDGRRVLSVTIGGRENRSPLVAEHGRLMHLFLLREPHLDAFAHLHPTTRDSVRFDAHLPALPTGRYRLIAEIVEQDGFPVTMSTGIDLASSPEPVEGCRECVARPDPEDAWSLVTASTGARRSVAADGSTFVRLAVPRIQGAGEEAGLRFAVFDPHGRPARLDPYLGMAGHAVVASMDGGVFVHLHPAGTISMVAQERLNAAPAIALEQERRSGSREVDRHVVTFPYGFPSPGDYRVFVQVKREGRIVTAAFDVKVVASRLPSNSDVTVRDGS